MESLPSFVAIVAAVDPAMWCAWVAGLCAAVLVGLRLRAPEKQWPLVALAVALLLPLGVAVGAHQGGMLNAGAIAWDSYNATGWRLETLAVWCDQLALRFALAGMPAVLVVLGLRLSASRIRPRPLRRLHWSHAIVCLGVPIQVQLFSTGSNVWVPTIIAVVVGLVGWAMADTALMGRSWRRGRLATVAAVLAWGVTVLTSVGALVAWRVGGLLRNLPWWDPQQMHRQWLLNVDEALVLSSTTLLIALPVLAVVVRLLSRSGLRPRLILAFGTLLVGGFMQGSGSGHSAPPQTRDRVLDYWPYPEGCPISDSLNE
jgi:hypothetical protein